MDNGKRFLQTKWRSCVALLYGAWLCAKGNACARVCYLWRRQSAPGDTPHLAALNHMVGVRCCASNAQSARNVPKKRGVGSGL